MAKNGTVIAAFATQRDRPNFPIDAEQQAAADLSAASASGVLEIAIADPLPTHRTAEARDRVDAGSRDRVRVAIPD